MAIGGVVINFAAKTSDAVRDVDKLSHALQDSGKKARTAGGMFAGALKAGVAGVGLAAAGAGVAFLDMAKGAYADKLAADKLDRALLKVKGTTEKQTAAVGDWVDQMELATLVADDDLRAALEKLLPATENITDAQKLAAAAWDASIGSGKDFAGIVAAMVKGVEGNTAALKRMFPWLDAGPDKVLTMAEAMKQLNKQFGGDAKKAADTDLFGRLGKAFGQIKEAIGGISLPALEELAGWFSDKKNIEAVQEWIDKVAEWATTVGEDLLHELQDFVTWLSTPANQQAIRDWMETMRQWAGVIGDLIDKLGTLYDLVMKLPSNQILKALGLIPDLTPTSQPKAPGNARSQSAPTLSVVINNPKPEKASNSIAAAQRVARNTGGGHLTSGW